MTEKSLDIVIIGGSLCGLFAGASLQRLGHKVQILERNPTSTLPARGAGIVSGPAMESFFCKHRGSGIVGIVNNSRIHLDVAGKIKYHEDRVQQTTSWSHLYDQLRKMYDGRESVVSAGQQTTSVPQNRAYRYGCTFLGFEEVDGKLEVKLANEEQVEESRVVDVLIGADGANSAVRNVVLPDIQPRYVGYAAWRGTVPESQVSAATSVICAGKVCFFFAEALQVVVYTIPAENSTGEAGARLVNWIWYMNYEAGSRELEELMTDCEGKRRHGTVPAGKVHPALWAEQKRTATSRLPPQLAELVERTTDPLVQCITDVLTPQSTFHDGRVLLVGDAVAGFRPHTGASTNQAALHALKLEAYLRGEMSLRQWEEQIMGYAGHMFQVGVDMGDESQFGGRKFPLTG